MEMDRSTRRWVLTMLAAAIACGAAAHARAEDGMPPMQHTDTGYPMLADSNGVSPAPSPNQYVSQNTGVADSALTARLAEVEKALKKIEDKAAADKAKAAGKPSVTVGGRIQWDTAAFSQNAQSLSQAGDMLNGTEFRRARLFAKGEAFDVIDYKFQVDFADSPVAFKDVYMTVKELPYAGNIRFGNIYECYGLNTQTSSNYITFMERSLISPVGGIGDRKPGIMAFDWNEAETMTWWIGCFAWQSVNPYDAFPAGTSYDDIGGYALDCALDVSAMVRRSNRGPRPAALWHGLYVPRDRCPEAGHRRDRFPLPRRSAARGPFGQLCRRHQQHHHLRQRQSDQRLQPEVAFVYGPFSVQSEYEWAFVNTTERRHRPVRRRLHLRKLLPHGRKSRLRTARGHVRPRQAV